MYATGHPPGASTPHSLLPAKSVSSGAWRPLRRHEYVINSLCKDYLPPINKLFTQPPMSLKGTRLSTQRHFAASAGGNSALLSTSTALDLHCLQTALGCPASERTGTHAPKYRLSVQQAVLVHAQPVVHLLIHSEMRDAPVDTSPHKSSATDAALFTPTDGLPSCHHQLRESTYRCDQSLVHLPT